MDELETLAAVRTPERTYVAFVLDKSGSMQKLKSIIVSGFNEHVQAIMENASKGGDTYTSLVLFSGQIHTEFFNAPVYALRELEESAYNPLGATAMRDAVGYTIDRLTQETDINNPNNSYLMIILSDGEENASKVWTEAQLSEKVKELQATDRWTFTYVGCNQDVDKVQRTLGFESTNMYKGWVGDDASSLQQMAESTVSLTGFFDERLKGKKSVKNFYGQQDT